MAKLPDTSEAEEWLDPDTFVVKGKVYRVGPKGEITVLAGYSHNGIVPPRLKLSKALRLPDHRKGVDN